MTDSLIALTLLIYIAFLVAMRWAHRNWGQAILATIFAPLVIVPLGAVCVMAVSLFMRGFNLLLEPLGLAVPPASIGWIGVAVAVGIILFLTIHFIRDQRSVSLIKTGPRLGIQYRAPRPNINKITFG